MIYYLSVRFYLTIYKNTRHFLLSIVYLNTEAIYS